MDIMSVETLIWDGRFQPVHLGHLGFIRSLLVRGQPVLVYMVDNELSAQLPHVKSPVPDFTAEVDRHHVRDKNPIPFWLRYQLLNATIKAEFDDKDNVTVWGGRRIDLHWEYLRSAFPPRRLFVSSTRDGFEDAKLRAWQALGERAEQVENTFGPVFSGTEFREAARKGDDLERYLSRHTLRHLDRLGMRDALLSMMGREPD